MLFSRVKHPPKHRRPKMSLPAWRCAAFQCSVPMSRRPKQQSALPYIRSQASARRATPMLSAMPRTYRSDRLTTPRPRAIARLLRLHCKWLAALLRLHRLVQRRWALEHSVVSERSDSGWVLAWHQALASRPLMPWRAGKIRALRPGSVLVLARLSR